jgi:hypothetical protein
MADWRAGVSILRSRASRMGRTLPPAPGPCFLFSFLYAAAACSWAAVRSIQKLQGHTFFPSTVGANTFKSSGIRAKLPSQPGNDSRNTSG